MSRLLAKHWAIALVVSLALNLFLGGMLAARCVWHPKGPPHGMRRMPLQALRNRLGPEAHAAIDQVDAKHSEAIRERMHEAREARRRAMDALTVDPFDETKAREAHADFRSKEAAAREAMHEALVELAAALPAEQRAQLGTAMSKRRGRRGPRDRVWRGKRDEADSGSDEPPSREERSDPK